ncbi:exosome complex component RRP42 isoform X5 [Carcharodon carcharias]|uniref:exosome complex component RRP42 isoform X5 n=1 Tax=Carcharodon carcharias TaxID=13397 RepID=UPI001B7F2BB7|nr:exosome complex component RRP42 isoform X5 [Carcharodon carcharias]
MWLDVKIMNATVFSKAEFPRLLAQTKQKQLQWLRHVHRMEDGHIPKDSCMDDLRIDGRGCEDYRHIEIETDVVSNTSGSARVKILLECGGNLSDAISIAVKAALHNTRIPKVRVLEDDEGSKEIELSDDPYDCIRLNVENVPCVITLSKIGYRHVVDATSQEEACCMASLLVSVTRKGTITCFRKVGGGSLDPASIFEMLETGNRVGKALHESLQTTLEKEESLGRKRQKVGFLG